MTECLWSLVPSPRSHRFEIACEERLVQLLHFRVAAARRRELLAQARDRLANLAVVRMPAPENLLRKLFAAESFAHALRLECPVATKRAGGKIQRYAQFDLIPGNKSPCVSNGESAGESRLAM